jgi:serine/threonine protein kinase/cytochrome c-type biogenesis protein CcmH/NrfG
MNKGRYEIRGKLGEGGMGIVHRAVDPVVNREVAVKTIRDAQDKAVLDLFRRECAVLATLSHPNIVEIFDVGEADEEGEKRPYFVMPILRGATLQELIRDSSTRLTVDRSIQIVSQVSRGLQAAHEHGLVHRDLKPSNLFILSDDSVKIIDFGMAHLVNHRSATGLKGTLLYMAPEQVQLKQATALSDQFSLAVVCYEMLARRHPFATQEDLAQAIVNFTPLPVSQFNPAVSPSISQVIHKALAKDAFHRFSNVREFSDCLQKALRGEPIDIFDPTRIAPRLERARKAFDRGDLEDATDIIKGLESENLIAPEITELSRQVEEVRRAKTIKQFLETAHRRLDEGEYVRALQKVQDILDLDPANTEAFTLKGAIESKRSATQIDEWFRLANQHMENRAYAHARQALEKVLEIRPNESRAQVQLAEVERREQESLRIRSEKQQAYQSALEAYRRGDINSALHKLERVLDLDRRAPTSTSPDQGPVYQKLYEEVRSRRDQLASKETEARRALDEGNFAGARGLCEEVLAAFPNNVVFRALQDDVEQAQRMEISAYLAKIERDVATEPDFNRKVAILEEAGRRYPSESRFEQSLQQVRARRDLVDSLVGRARTAEEAKQFSDALGIWEMLRKIHPQHPGISIELDRLQRRREQQLRSDAKTHWVTQIDQALGVQDYQKAALLAGDALAEHPGDLELSALEKQARQFQSRAREAEEKAQLAKELVRSGDVKGGLDLFREAYRLDTHNVVVRTGLTEVLLKKAGETIDADWKGASTLVQEALDLDSSNPLAKSLDTLIQDKRQAEEVSTALSRVRELQAEGKVRNAIAEIDQVRQKYPREDRLIKFRAMLVESLPTLDRNELRVKDLEELNKLAAQSKKANDYQELESIFQKSSVFAKYGDDAEFRRSLTAIEERVKEATAGFEVSQATGGTPPPIYSEAPAVADSIPPVHDPAPRAKRNIPASVKMAIGVGAGFIGMVLVFMAATDSWPRFSKGSKAAPSPTLVTVAVNGTEGHPFEVLDATGKEVTDRLSSGLNAGQYVLRANKPGFHFEETFSVDSAQGATRVLAVQWEALPTLLKMNGHAASGSLTADGGKVDSGASFKNGHHSVVWRDAAGDEVRTEFDVRDDSVVMSEPRVAGRNVAGIVFAASRGRASYWAINSVSGVVETVDGSRGEAKAWAGSFSLQGVKSVRFERKFDKNPLGEFLPEESGAPVVSMVINSQVISGTSATVRPQAASPHKDEKVPTPTPLPQIEAPPPPPPQEDLDKAKEEARRKFRERLGLKDTTKKQ